MKKHASMNRAFRLVWSDSRGAYVAVQETAKGHGKSAGTTGIVTLLAVGLAALPGGLHAQSNPSTTIVPVDPKKTEAFIGPNGVPIVNIATPNAAGLSHNQYLKFNVQSNGAVLNNGDPSLATRQSKLAGQVNSNLNLQPGVTAKVILNEVTANNRSVLQGYTEVLGAKADVILANPWGITCSGCGFINTDRVTFTTGTPRFALDGSVSGFMVNRGDVLINGLGLDLTSQQIMDIVARSVKIDGPINLAPGASSSLGFFTGTNIWDYTTRAVTGAASADPTDPTPALALDSTVLGGMYAGRIRIIATEAGVGVRMMGEVAATGDDFQLTSAGRVELRNKMSAARDVSIASTLAKSEALALVGAQITAGQDASLSATSGAATIQGGSVVATRVLDVKAGSLADSATTDAITDNNRRSGAATSLTATDATTLAGVSWESKSSLSISAGSLVVDASRAATLSAVNALSVTAGTDLTLAGAGVKTAGDISLSATTGTLSTAASSLQYVQSTGGNVSLGAGKALINAGVISADSGDLTVRASGALNNSGLMQSKGKLDIADQAGGATQSISNTGTLYASGAMSVLGNAMSNSSAGRIQGDQGVSVKASSLSNDGLMVMSPSTTVDGSIEVGTLSVGFTGVIQSGRDLTIKAASLLDNDGYVLADRHVNVTARDSGTTLSINNRSNGYVQSGGTLTISGTAGGSNASIASNAGVMYGVGNVAMSLSSASNSGYIQSEAALTLGVTGAITNTKNIIAGTSATISADSLSQTSAGTVQAEDALSVTARTISNDGLVNGGNGGANDTTINASTLSNSANGVIQAARNVALNLAERLDNSGQVIADGGALTVSASDSGKTLVVNNQSSGYLGAAGTVKLQGTSGASNVSLATQAGTILGDVLSLSAAYLNNSGWMQSDTAMTLAATSGLVNSGAAVAGTTMLLNAGSLSNSGTLQTADGLTLNATTASNSGLIVGSSTAGKDATLNIATLTSNTGTIQAARDLTLNATSALDNDGFIASGRDLRINAASAGSTLAVTNRSNGVLQAGNGLLSIAGTSGGRNVNLSNLAGDLYAATVSATGVGITNSGVIQSLGTTNLDLSGNFSNSGALYSAGRIDLAAGNVSNTSTVGIQGGAAIDVRASGTLANSGVILGYSGSQSVGISAASITNSSGGTIQSALDLNLAPTAVLDNSGALYASRNLSATAGNSGTTAFMRNRSTGVMQAGSTLVAGGTASGGGYLQNAKFDDQSGTLRAGEIIVSASELRTSAGSRIEARDNLSFNAAGGVLSLYGRVQAGTAASLSGNVTSQVGTLQSGGAMTLHGGSLLENYGLILAGTDGAADLVVDGVSLDNRSGALVQSGRDLFGAFTTALNNSGTIYAERNATIQTYGGSGTLTVDNRATGLIQAGGTLSIAPEGSGGNNLRMNFQQGTLVAGTLKISAPDLSNTNTIQADKALYLNLGGTLDNQGAILSGGTLAVSGATTIANASGAYIQNVGAMSIAAQRLVNTGYIIGSSDGTSTSNLYADSLTNTANGQIYSSGGLGLSVGSALTNAGVLAAGTALAVSGSGTALEVSNSGVIQSTGALRIGYDVPVSVNNTSSGVILTSGTGFGTMELYTSSLTNAGVIQGVSNTTVTSASGLTNSSLISGAGRLKISAATLTNNSGAYIETGNYLDMTGTTLTNAGTILSTASSFGNFNTIDSTWLTNQAGGQINMKWHTNIGVRNTLDNSGTITTTDGAGLSIIPVSKTQDVMLHNRASGIISSDLDLDIGFLPTSFRDEYLLGGGYKDMSIATQAGQILSGERFRITSSGNLTNTGVIQASAPYSRSDSLLGSVLYAADGTLTNAAGGRITLQGSGSSSEESWVGTRVLINAGTIESAGGASLWLGTNSGPVAVLNNTGRILMDGKLIVQKSTTGGFVEDVGSYTVSSAGRMDIGGKLQLRGLTNFSIPTGATFVAGQLDLRAPTLTVGNDVALTTLGETSIETDRLVLSNAGSRVVVATGGSSTGTIKLAQAFTNANAIHSGGNLFFSAPSITNSSSGGFSALNNLSLVSTGGDLRNAGALYAGNGLGVSATGTLTNVGSTIVGGGGSIDAGGDMDLRAKVFVNNSDINSAGNIAITADFFRNEVLGGDTRTYINKSAETFVSNDYYADGYMPGSVSPDTTYHRLTTTFTGTLGFAGGLPVKPGITANGNITIGGFTTAANTGGVISAGQTLAISSNVAKASFTNQALDVLSGTFTSVAEYYCTLSSGSFIFNLCTTHNAIADAARTFTSTDITPNSTVKLAGLGAGLYADKLVATGFTLTNLGNPFKASVDTVSSSGTPRAGLLGLLDRIRAAAAANKASAASLTGGLASIVKVGASVPGAGTPAALLLTQALSALTGQSLSQAAALRIAANASSGIVGATTASGQPLISFKGLNIVLPTNPNGLFVIAKDPQAKFLVESNPLFQVGQNFVGSDYLAQRYGYNPDTSIKRLGDSNYEAYLIRQQLINQTGNNLLAGLRDEATQMQTLMDNALKQSKELGLSYGAAPTEAQLKNLKSDIVWMVETVVDGKRVLVPVVYLSQATKDAIETGAVIAGNDVTLNVSALNNTGGTVSGRNNLSVTSKGDITNTGGTIKGGNVNLVSTTGSVINQTIAQTIGNSKQASTVIGKTGLIAATGNLNINAGNNVTVLGANVTAGGNASINAKNNVTFDTIQDKTTTTETETERSRNRTTTTTTTTTTTNQIKSGLTVGGNLQVGAGKDITLAGTQVEAGGNIALRAQGNVNIVARDNTTQTSSQTDSKATGAFSSLRSSSSSTTDSLSTRNVGTEIKAGGNLTAIAGTVTDGKLSGGNVNIVGSNLNAGGNLALAGQSVTVTEGRDTDTSTTTTKTKSLFTTTGSSGSGTSGSERGSASGGGQAQGGGATGVAFNSTTTTKTTSVDSRAVGSGIKAGGNVVIQSTDNTLLRGAEVQAGGNTIISGKDVNIESAKNIQTTTTTTKTSQVGLFLDSSNSASGKGGAEVVGTGTGRAGASGEASSNNNLDVARQTTTTTTTLQVTNTGSKIGAGGVLVINADNNVNIIGSQVSGDQGVGIKAGKDINVLAAKDVNVTTTSTKTTSQGLYVDGGASADASVTGGVGGAMVDKTGSAKVSAGVQARSSTQVDVNGTTTAITSGITSKSGNVERTAGGTITDVGTNIEAGGSVIQKAANIISLAAENTTISSSTTENKTGRVGVFAGADTEGKTGMVSGASAKDTATTVMQQGGVGGSSGANKGVEISYAQDKTGQENRSSTAVVGTIKAGGNVQSTATNKTVLQGTDIQAGGNVVISSKTLDIQAARDTTSEVKTGTGFAVGAEITKQDVTLTGEFKQSGSQSQTSTAKTANITGNNVSLNTTGDMRLEGTNVTARQGLEVNAGGNLNIETARNTSSSSSNNLELGGELSVGRKAQAGQPSNSDKAGAKFSATVDQSKSSSDTGVGATLKAGGPVTVNAGGNATLEATNVDSGTGQRTLNAGGNVNITGSRDTSSSSAVSGEVNISAQREKGQSFGNAGFSASSDSSSTVVQGNAGTMQINKTSQPPTPSSTPAAAPPSINTNVPGIPLAQSSGAPPAPAPGPGAPPATQPGPTGAGGPPVPGSGAPAGGSRPPAPPAGSPPSGTGAPSGTTSPAPRPGGQSPAPAPGPVAGAPGASPAPASRVGAQTARPAGASPAPGAAGTAAAPGAKPPAKKPDPKKPDPKKPPVKPGTAPPAPGVPPVGGAATPGAPPGAAPAPAAAAPAPAARQAPREGVTGAPPANPGSRSP